MQVNAPLLVAATFRHVTSRNNDPQLHTHCVIANMTCDGGQWRSAEIGLLRRSEKLIGAYYRNELAHGLRRAGFALRPSMIGRVPGFEISGWPRAVLEAFSSRRKQILDFIREKGWRYDARTAQRATLATRARKNEPHRAELEALWRDFAEERGLAKRTLRKIGVRRPPPLTAVEVAWRALEQLEERASVFPARDALALALAHSPGLYRLEAIEEAFAALQQDKHLLPALRRGVGEAWTTARAVRAECEVLERMKAGLGAVTPLVREPISEEALTGLTAGQREAVTLILESRDRVLGVQGHAGTGKTTMLRRAVSCLGERRVLGLAPSASAARTLARETGLACRTLQWFLTRCKEVADGVADAETLAGLKDHYRGSVVVVDEMSLVGTGQARALLRIAERLAIARLVLVGDKRQLRGVEAGQPFRQMQQAGMSVVEMDELRRQRDPDLKAAVEEMIEGEPGAALDRLGSNLQEVPAEEIAQTAAALWLRLSPEARDGTALLVPTRARRAEVEEAVREGLEAEGVLGGTSLELETLVPLNLTRAEAGDVRNWREGDIALFNRDMKHYRVARDDACTVMAVEEDRVRLSHADGRPRHLKPGSDLRYRLDLFEAKTLTLRAGEQLRWTRNDKARGLANGDRATLREVRDNALRLQLADGRQMTFARDDPQLRHLAYAYASTVHAAQGQTHERVIAVLDTGAGPLVNQQTLYVQLSRAREQAVVLTDNREQLVETLEANTGERLTALEAIGEAADTAAAPVKAAVSVAADFLEGLGAERRAAGRRAEATALVKTAVSAAAETAARSEVAVDTPEIQAADECRRLRAAVAQAGPLIYQPGVEALGADATRLLATPGLSEGDRRFLESLKEVIDSETRVRDDIRDMIERARAHLREYPDIRDRAPEPPEAPRPGFIARARRLLGTQEHTPAPMAPPRALNDFDPDYRKWDIRAELFVKTFRHWRTLDNPAYSDHLDRRRIDIADLIAEFEAIRRAARDPQAEPHRIELPDAGAFAAADQRHDPGRLAVLLQAAIRPEEERDRAALVELARRNRAWPEETHAAFCHHVRAADERSLFRLEPNLPATLAGSFRNLSEECWRHRGEALMRQQELTREHGLSY